MPAEIIPFGSRQVPTFAQGRRSTLLDNARAGVQPSFAVLGFKGKVWRLKHNGTETVLQVNNIPMPTIDVVIVGVAGPISRNYYEKNFVDGDDSAPECSSLDGIRPDIGVAKKQSDLCSTCPHSEWGSKITDAGKRAQECQQNRRVAIVPYPDVENKAFGGPVLLRIPPMSLRALQKYSDEVERKGGQPETVVTRLGFDMNAAYPLITFTPVDFIDEDQARIVLGPNFDGVDGLVQHPVLRQMMPAEASEEREPAPTRQDPPPPQRAPEPPPPEPEPEEVVEDETPVPPTGAVPINPFAAAAQAATKTNGTVAPKQQRKAAAPAAAPVEAAPVSMQEAIDDLLKTSA